MDIFETLFPHSLSVAIFGFLTMVLGFAALAVLELIHPARREVKGREGRMTVNFGLGLTNMALSAILPLSSLAMVNLAASEGWGLFRMFPTSMAFDWLVAFPAFLLVKSLVGYTIHWSFHNVAWLWPLHQVHHRDDAIDLSTSFRSHPISHILVLVPNALLALALGPDLWVVLVAEAVLFLTALFQHANLHMPDNISDRLERWIVTPRMHLVHHARERHLHDGNYGEIFSFWDHLFGTYKSHPAGGMAIGVEVPAKPVWRIY